MAHFDKAEALVAIIARYPATFGLRDHDGVFRISPTDSYWRDENLTPVLYLDVSYDGAVWYSWAKCTQRDLMCNLVKLGGEP